MTTVAVKTHHFVEKPTEVDGVTTNVMVCDECGARMDDAAEGEECQGADLGEEGEEIAARADEQPAPQAALPFPAPPFDAERWAERIEAKNDSVRAAARTLDDLESRAKDARKQANEAREYYERVTKELSALIVQRRDEKQAAQPRLVRREPKSDGTLVCLFEEQAAEACPLCRAGIVFGDPQSEEHRLEAEQRFNARRTAHVELMNAAEHNGWNLTLETIEEFTDEQRERLQAWIDNGGETPAVLGRPHRAGEPGTSVQPCSVCGCVLVDLTKAEAFPIPDRVGVDCDGPADETVANA